MDADERTVLAGYRSFRLFPRGKLDVLRMRKVRRSYEAENRALAGLALGCVLIVAGVVVTMVWSLLVGVIGAVVGVFLFVEFTRLYWE